MTSSARVWVFLAPGFEEIEAITVLDVLRRAGCDVLAVGLDDNIVMGAHQIAVSADCLLHELASAALPRAIVLPGGMPGATHLRDRQDVQQCIRTAHEQGVLLAAICAAPIALARAGILTGRTATCYPGFERELVGTKVVQDAVVVDGKIVTSRGVGTALAFALKLVELLTGEAAARMHADKMLVG